MDSIFGLPMTSILIAVVTLMALCLLTTASIALRNRVIFRMALRNIPRRRAQTVLIMVGLMLSTLIIAAALTTGDTVDHSITKSTYDNLGEVDETLAYVGESEGGGTVSVANTPFPTDIVDELAHQLDGHPDIDGIMPVLTSSMPVSTAGDERSEPQVTITGLDAARLDDFGGLATPGGSDIDFGELPDGVAVVSEELADSLGLQAGDGLNLYYQGEPVSLTVAAISKNSILTGYQPVEGQAGPASIDSADMLGVAVPLAWLQDLTGMEGQARFIAVSNAGDTESGVDRTDDATEAMQAALAGIEGGEQLGINPIKQDAIEGAETFGSTFTTLFLVMGLFSIAAGILLIFLIFMMLAAERRSEMGISRAIGMTRSHLMQSFIAEGAVYDLAAALIGAAAGVLVAFGIGSVLGNALGDMLTITPQATWRSLVVAYALGVSVTFLTIIFASLRSSRLNIVAAIRDLPDEGDGNRGVRPRWSWWSTFMPADLGSGGASLRLLTLPVEFVWNVVLIGPKLAAWLIRMVAYALDWGLPVAGIGLAFAGFGVSLTNMFTFALGLSLIVLGLMLVMRAWLPERLVYSAGAVLMLLYWLLPADVTSRVLPDVGDGGPEMLVVSGIFTVLYSTLIIMWNADLIVKAVALPSRAFSSWLPAIKVAVAYPLASRGRSGMTIAMFSIVVFALLMVATISTNFQGLLLTDSATAGWDIEVTTNASNPIDDLEPQLEESDFPTSDINAIGRVDSIDGASSLARNPGSDEWLQYSTNSMDAHFIEHAEVKFRARADGYASDQAIWRAIQSGEPVAIIDNTAFDDDGFGGAEGYLAPADIDLSDGSFAPFDVEVQGPASDETATITVIGVIDTSVSTMRGFYLGERAFDEVYSSAGSRSFFVQLNEDASAGPSDLAMQIQGALRTSGVKAESIMDQIEENQEFSTSFFTLMESFMGLGLFVGLAALGVISFRSVVERRQQIGMLRAIGFERGMITTSFMLESLLTAALGVLSGAGLALALSYNLIMYGEIGNEDFTEFLIPGWTIAIVIGAALIATAFMTWIPARKAATVPISEALRYE